MMEFEATRPSGIARSRRTILGTLALLVAPALVLAQDRVDDFRTNCASCHTIGGGRLVGPDLRGVTERKDREWLARFIVDPKAMIDSGDPYAQQLLLDARGVMMPAIPGMTVDRATRLIELVEAESTVEKPQFTGVQVSDRPFTAADVAQGGELFVGRSRLSSGGPACVSCHSVNGLGVLAGGKLGPDLNQAFERLGGRAGLTAWLSAPATPTMQAIFRARPLDSAEVLPLVAFFADKSVTPPESGQAATLIFTLLGLSGTAAMLVIFDVAWRRRFRAVREPLVRQGAAKGRG